MLPINKFISVIENKRNHALTQFKGDKEEYTKLKYKFKTSRICTYEEFERFNKRFYSYLLFQWSKRKHENKTFNMWVSCLVVENQYIHRYDDVFLFDESETEILKKSQELLNILNHFYFPDVEVYFFIEDGDDKKEDKMHLLEDVLKMIQKDFLIKYDFYSVIKEYIHLNN